MLSLNECKRILKENSNKLYTDEQVKFIREKLYQLAEIEIKKYKLKKNEGNNVCQSIY